ncbi:baseplate J/gp47 family protein [Actinoplanes sp. DH11]|uniref:baseplate J/gp47 family protein n=1 Tax=Actinoplanes sp. DH11 TaxID=2857011 RepID=UPI001E43AF9D|nr:baseplate J/gp47 family protein [Actinoplanes sp. DH11]
MTERYSCGGGGGCGCGCGGDATDRTGNPPGLIEVAFTASAYPAALDRMRRRLSSAELPALRGLTARGGTPPLDPTPALIDGWACVGHVLGFYHDRLVNEHYLRTCRHLRSATGLARLVGYTPRPGLAADAYLVFTLEDLDPEAQIAVPAGTRAYSQPGPGETMQPFETDEALTGRPRWSVMRPRLTEPAVITPETTALLFAGTGLGLAQGDRLVLKVGDAFLAPAVATVEERPDPTGRPELGRTRVVLDREPDPAVTRPAVELDSALLQKLLIAPAAVTAGRDRPALTPQDIFAPGSYAAYALVESSYPGLRDTLDVALGGSTHAGASAQVAAYVLRVRAGVHGGTALPIADFDGNVVRRYRRWNQDGTGPQADAVIGVASAEPVEPFVEGAVRLEPKDIALDAVYPTIVVGGLVVVLYDDGFVHVDQVEFVRVEHRANFLQPARVTVLTLRAGRPTDPERVAADDVRVTAVHAQSEALALAEVPVGADVSGDTITLDGFYPGLRPLRRLLLTGERTDVATRDGSLTSVPGSELVMITTVEHRSDDAVEGVVAATLGALHTRITVTAPGLAFSYRPQTVRLFGNVAHATHGESRAEVLGSGDAGRALQTFALKQGPLTHISAATGAGERSTLQVRVEDLVWQQARHAADIGPGERSYVAGADDAGRILVTFGLGARLPTGADNVHARYRTGLGRAGNVRAGQISVLASRPAGVSAVTNPLVTTGGVDPDGADAVRRRAPVGLAALERLVSVTDFEDFARAFAGIGKASVSRPDPARHDYVLTVAAADDAPLSAGSQLILDLRAALLRFAEMRPGPDDSLITVGPPQASLVVRVRTALLLVVRARIRLERDFVWEPVRARLAEAAEAAFGFAAAEIGVVPRAGAVMATLQGVRGVALVDLRTFGVIGTGAPGLPDSPQQVAATAAALFADPAQNGPGLPPDPPVPATAIAYLSPTAPGTLLLELDEEAAG